MTESNARRVSRRSVLVGGVQGIAVMALGSTVVGCAPDVVGPLLPEPGGTGWKQYPHEMFGNPTFTFPTIEGRTNNETDTWYVHGKLTGQVSGRDYGFLTIFAKNRVNAAIRADIYTLAIFPLDRSDYGTYTATDVGLDTIFNPALLTAADGHLDLKFAAPAGASTWRTRIDGTNHLVPFEYDLDLHGVDANGQPMAVIASMNMQEAPTGPGDGPDQGIIRIQGQENTLSYFQTGPLFNGTITYDGVTEPVTGTIGHMDRQLFPLYAGVVAGPYSRDHGHYWGSIHLSDGTTVSQWEQYNRPTGNVVEPFSGMTRFFPTTETSEFDAGLQVTPTSYVKWPNAVVTSVTPPSPNRYLMSGHVLDVAAWDLHLVGSPITAAPAHALPVEYMSGPADYTGTIAGQAVTGYGHNELTAALFRNWELAGVVLVSVANLPDDAFLPGGASRPDLVAAAGQLVAAYGANDDAGAATLVGTVLVPGVASLAAAEQPFLSELLADTLAAPTS